MQLGNYAILRELSSKSFLARDHSGRQVVLKLLPGDCMLEGQLNPNIAQRLRRVREIAMTDVANLRGVDRDGERVFLVWDFVEGVPFDSVATANLARELIHTVEQFHATGLVHGALHGGNVLVDNSGRIRLIDVSPLLFLDPQRDLTAAQRMCERFAEPAREPDRDQPRVQLRRRSLIAAILLLLVGIAATIAIQRLLRSDSSPLLTPPRISR